jgi:hypothetical protein
VEIRPSDIKRESLLDYVKSVNMLITALLTHVNWPLQVINTEAATGGCQPSRSTDML